MKRREFLLSSAMAAGAFMIPGAWGRGSAEPSVAWGREGELFTSVLCDGRPMSSLRTPLLSPLCRSLHGTGETPATITSLTHSVRNSGAGCGEDLLEAGLRVTNTSASPIRCEIGFASAVQPSPRAEDQRVYLPLSAAALLRDERFSALGMSEFLQDCSQHVGGGNFKAHYLEPMASHRSDTTTRALLLAPVIQVSAPGTPWRTAIFTPSDEPMRFHAENGRWEASREVLLAPGESWTARCWLLLHKGDASEAWSAFHRFAHREDHQIPDWVRGTKVHYFDYLSSAAGEHGRRGDGYDADLASFRRFGVGLATQHGYYPSIGDYIRPDRPSWMAMRGDRNGPAPMTIKIMQRRIADTRATGAKAAVYMHAALFDDAAPCFNNLQDCIQVDANGSRMGFGWTGPDTAGKTWRASLASAEWRDHLLEQAGWIMEILKPDAIVVDETFAGLGYDYHPGRSGPTSGGAIDFYRRLRSLVRSHGSDKAFFSSDCSMSPFVLWADGECGDHAYTKLLGHHLYAEQPVRYLAALGDKPWIPCAWNFGKLWDQQLHLARLVGAGVGVSNGWIEYTGLARLPEATKNRMLADIASLKGNGKPSGSPSRRS